MKSNDPDADPRASQSGGEFFSFLQALRSRFQPTDAAATDDELLEWFAIDDDEDETAPAPLSTPMPGAGSAAARALETASTGTTAAEELPDLPLHLAPPLPSWPPILVETALGFLFLGVLESTLGNGLGSHGLHPHPYWLVVLPMAAARGFVGGLFAASIGAAMYFGGLLATIGLGAWAQLFTFENGIEPLGFFVAAFLIGQFRDLQSQRAEELWRTLLHLATDRARAGARIGRLQQQNRELKVRLLDHSAQFGHLLDAARRLETAGRRELVEVALDMIAEHCNTERCSAIEFSGGQVRVVAMKGWATGEVDLLMQQAGMAESIQAAWERGERYDAFAPDQVALQHGPLLIAPLLDHDGRVDLLLCVDALAAERFHRGLASIFFGIAEWAQIGLQRLARGEVLTQRTVTHGNLTTGWIGEAEDLLERLRIEQVRMERLRVRTSVLAIHARFLPEHTERDRRRFDQLVEATIENGLLRSSDTIYRTQQPGAWIIVLPATPEEQAGVVRARLETFLASVRHGRVKDFELKVFAPSRPQVGLRAVVDDAAAWMRTRSGFDAPIVPAEAPAGHVEDAMGFARRLEVEAPLSRRWTSDLYVVTLELDVVRTAEPQLLPRRLRELGDRFLDAAASLHELDAGCYAAVLPFVNCQTAFRTGQEMARALTTLVGGSIGLVDFNVYALAGRADEGQFLIERLLRHRVPAAVEQQLQEALA